MNKYLVYASLLLVGLGLGYFIPHGANNNQGVLGGLYQTNPSQFVSGFTAGGTNQLSVDSSGVIVSSAAINSSSALNGTTVLASLYKTATIGNTASTTSSTVPNLAFGAAAAGVFTIGTGTPAINYANVSTTAVTINSQIFLTPSATTTVPGTTCNATPTTTWVSAIFPGSGFQIKTPFVPVTNPICGYWRILN